MKIVQAVHSAYEDKAFAEILKLLLSMIQEIIIGRILGKSPDAPSCCEHGHLALNGHYRRRTSLGDLELHVKKVRCSICGKSFVPLLRHVNIGKDQTKSNEFEQLVVETVSETSCRRGMEPLARDGRNAPLFRTANGWTLQTDYDEIQLYPEVWGVSGKADSPDTPRESSLKIYADGMGFKGAPGRQCRKGRAEGGDWRQLKGGRLPIVNICGQAMAGNLAGMEEEEGQAAGGKHSGLQRWAGACRRVCRVYG